MPWTSAGNGTTHAVYVPAVISVNLAASPARMITHCDAPAPAAAIRSDSSLAVFAVIAPVASHALATPSLPDFGAASTSTSIVPGSTARSTLTSWPDGTTTSLL